MKRAFGYVGFFLLMFLFTYMFLMELTNGKM